MKISNLLVLFGAISKSLVLSYHKCCIHCFFYYLHFIIYIATLAYAEELPSKSDAVASQSENQGKQ